MIIRNQFNILLLFPQFILSHNVIADPPIHHPLHPCYRTLSTIINCRSDLIRFPTAFKVLFLLFLSICSIRLLLSIGIHAIDPWCLSIFSYIVVTKANICYSSFHHDIHYNNITQSELTTIICSISTMQSYNMIRKYNSDSGQHWLQWLSSYYYIHNLL